jgi:hypothetical protein
MINAMRSVRKLTAKRVDMLKQFLCANVRESNVGAATGYGLDDRESVPGGGNRVFFTPQLSDRLWGPPSLLSYGYRGLVPGGISGRGLMLTTPSGAQI